MGCTAIAGSQGADEASGHDAVGNVRRLAARAS
ncbi:MAG: hypothetical protein QOF98_1017, partial [Streptomyces sp.]|nr:hypothetical protein [Streptomyces sp.]